MELKWIEDFLTLANCNSMRQAAAARNISQSTLSRRLTNVEQRMGCTLVDRQHNPMKLTPAGQDFLEFAKRWHRELIQHRLQTRRGLTHGSVRISVWHSLALSLIPRIWASTDDLEDISCTIYSGNVADSVEDLESGQVDIMLGYYHYSEPEITNIGFASHRLGQSLLVPVVKTDSPIHRQIEKNHTCSIPVIASTPNVYNRRILEFMRREVWQQKPEFDIRLQCDNVGVIKSLTLQGVGVAWLPSLIIEQELEAGVLSVVSDDQWIIETDIVLYHQTSAANAAVHKVIMALKQLDLSPPTTFSVS